VSTGGGARVKRIVDLRPAPPKVCSVEQFVAAAAIERALTINGTIQIGSFDRFHSASSIFSVQPRIGQRLFAKNNPDTPCGRSVA